MLSSWLRRRQARSSAPKRRRPAGFRPRLECLEDRTVPATPAGYAVNLLASAPTVAFGQPLTLTATVSGPQNGPLPGGDVVFLDGGTTTLGQVPVPQGGNATFQATLSTVPALTVGSHDLTAVYQATQPSGAPVSVTSNDVTETVTEAVSPPAPAAPAPAAPAPALQEVGPGLLLVQRTPAGSLDVAALWNGPAGPATGLVLFTVSYHRTALDPITTIAEVGRVGSVVDLGTVSPIVYSVQAVYLGDANYLPAIEASEADFRFGAATQITLGPPESVMPLLLGFSPDGAPVVGIDFSLTGRITEPRENLGPEAGPITGVIYFYVDGQFFASSSLKARQHGSFRQAIKLSPGSHTIVVAYSSTELSLENSFVIAHASDFGGQLTFS